jgi:hypothetical protein
VSGLHLEGTLHIDSEEFLVDLPGLQPLRVPIPVRGDLDAVGCVTTHGKEDEADREVVGLAGCLAEVEPLLLGWIPTGVLGLLPGEEEGLVPFVLPPVEADEVGADLGRPGAVLGAAEQGGLRLGGGIVLEGERDPLPVAVTDDDVQGLQADLLPLLGGEVLGTTPVM